MRLMTFLGALLLSANAFAQALATAPRSDRPQGSIGAVIGKPAAAGAAYDESVAKARALIKENKLREALELSEQAIKLDDKRWEAYVTAASAYSSQGLLDDAIGMLQMSLTRAPDDRKPLIRDALAESRRQLSAPQPQAGAAGAPGAAAPAPTQAEVVLWKTIEKSTSASDFSAFLTTYPKGIYAPLAEARIETLTEASKTSEQRLADVVGKIVALSNNVKVGNSTQNVFAAGCRLSVVRDKEPSATIDLRSTNEEYLSVESSGGIWWVSQNITLLKGPNAVRLLNAKDQDSVSQLFALLPEAVKMCKVAGGQSDSAGQMLQKFFGSSSPAEKAPVPAAPSRKSR